MGKKILVIGPESTGKSTLTEQLGRQYSSLGYDVAAIQEFARDWIDQELQGDMNRLRFEHITLFGTTQMRLVDEAAKEKDLVFSDTDAITSLVFQQVYFNRVDDALLATADNEVWDLILFTQPDVPWVDDGQRNLGHRRKEIGQMFQHELEKRNLAYVVVKRNWDERFYIATKAVDELMELARE